MQNKEIAITGIHLELTDAIKDITNHKIRKLFRHSNEISGAKVELECSQHKHNANEFIAKAILSLQGPAIVVKTSTENLYKSIDQLVAKLDRKIRRRTQLLKIKRKNTAALSLA